MIEFPIQATKVTKSLLYYNRPRKSASRLHNGIVIVDVAFRMT